MPDTRQSLQNNAVSSSDENLEEAMWRLKVQENQEGGDAHPNPYPDRPGEPDCIYFLRTGMCGYGSNCRYNHPTYTGQGTEYMGELPERVGQPDCQYFLKTGTCKFGTTCKYHHPQEKLDARPVLLNALALPMRQDEKSCPYYMRTGNCKFGIACKFHHPQPATLGAVFPVAGSSAYGSPGSPLAPPTSLPLISGFSAWPLERNPYMSSPRIQGLPAYVPVVIPPSQGTMPMQQGWSTYTGTVQGTVGHMSTPDITQTSNYKNFSQLGMSNPMNLPDRPEQPECQYYLKTGSCKYGTSCKYHHPKDRNTTLSSCTFGPLGLPLRPGQSVCTFYSTYGTCKYGPSCKYDHPLEGYYNYTHPALSFPDPSSAVFLNQRNSQPLWTSAESFPLKSLSPPQKPVEPETKNEVEETDHELDGDHPAQNSPPHTANNAESQQDPSN